MKLLITFGCSWTFGVGVGYRSGMTDAEYKSLAWDHTLADHYSFRGLLCQNYQMDNINLSKGGCSNQEQFRIAEDFFSSIKFQECQKKYSDIVVLWGITSVLRDETYFTASQTRKSFFYTDKSLLSKVIIAEHYDQANEIDLLSKKIRFWDKFFDLNGIKNIWFDTFNHHDYWGSIPDAVRKKYQSHAGESWPTWDQFCRADFSNVSQEIQDEILGDDQLIFYNDFYDPTQRMAWGSESPRDLMSRLALRNGMIDLDYSYHISNWLADSNRVEFLTNAGLLNPYTYHPTQAAHQQLADMLEVYII